MECLPEELIDRIHEFRPVHPTAVMISDFYRRIGYAGYENGIGEDDEDLSFCL